MMASDDIIDVSESNFDTQVLEYSFKLPVVVDFWADWCVPCKTLGPLLERLANEADGGFRLAKVDVDANQNLAIRFGVHSIPLVKCFREGKVVAEFVGAQPESRIKEFLKAIAPNKFDLLNEKADSFLKEYKWQQALQIYQEVTNNDPQNTKALLGLAKSLIATNQTHKALEILNKFPASKEYRSVEYIIPLAKSLINYQKNLLNNDDPLVAAFSNSLRLIQRGNFFAAMDGLLDILKQNKNYRNGEVREILVGLFEVLGEDNEITRQYRQELASILF